MNWRLSKGKGINKQFGLIMSALLFLMVFFTPNVGGIDYMPIVAFLIAVVGLQTALIRGGLDLANKGSGGLDQARNWFFIYSSILFGLIKLGLINPLMFIFGNSTIADSLAITTFLTLGLTVLVWIMDGGSN